MSHNIRIFLGSSSESKLLSEQLLLELDKDFSVQHWDSFFEPSSFTLEDFESKIHEFKYAVFILHPDDYVVSRGISSFMPRDNIIFEIGLFVGAIGRKNVLVLEPMDNKVKIPSDILGLTTIRYRLSDAINNMKSVSLKIKNHIAKIQGNTFQQDDLWPMKIAVISKDKTYINRIQLALNCYSNEILSTKIYDCCNDLRSAIVKREIHAIIIDVFSFERSESFDLISYVRDRQKEIGIVISGTCKELYTLPGVTKGWREILMHYWMIRKDIMQDSFVMCVEDVIVQLFFHRLTKGKFGDISGSVVENIFRPNVIGSLTEWEKF